ncbi:hypothetical protein KB559_10760 [Paenibacillus sp. Marseille-P2973]|uniref:hypothetical protein n=1 Tax=Paenibacillus sp. Marseille-P2973 TaxID=1871032 RepID=UPI001B358738|nr:hypothetical protein [Paenibacillus sp. Marseille-P2973]MBQ4899317.1 hypothetical protein [Paenibacillus sp. Marseille-P2973]
MRIRWKRQSSRAGLISAVVTRNLIKGMDMEVALELSLPNYSANPEGLSQFERKRILKEAMKELKRIEEARRGGTGRQRARG